MAITYGNTIWNYATNNADKVTFRVAAGKACDELKRRMDNSGMNYCGYNDNSGKVAVFAINKSDKDLLKLIIGDKAYNNLEFYKSEIDYIPKENKIGNTEYKYMPNKCYFYFNKDLALFLANQLAQQNIPYSAVIRSEKSAIMTVSEENAAVLLNLAEQIKNNRLIFSDEFKKYKTASAKKETIVSQPLTKKEKSFTESNIAAFMAQAILNDKQKQAQLDNYYERIKAGDNIPELAKSMLGNTKVFTTPHGNTFTLEHSDENWVSAAFGNAHKIVTYEELNKAFISLAEENHRNFDRLEHNPDKPVEIIEFQRTFETPLDKAKWLINDFCEAEYRDGADFSDLHNVGLAFTTLTDDELPIQVTADLVDFKITYEFDGEVYNTEQYDNIEDMIENGLTGLDFSDLVSVPDDVIDRHKSKDEQTVELMSDASEVQDISSVEDVPERTANDIKLGDRYLLSDGFDDKEVTVTKMFGIYPDDVGITEIRDGGEFTLTKNIDKFKLHNKGKYLGNINDRDFEMSEKEQKIFEDFKAINPIKNMPEVEETITDKSEEKNSPTVDELSVGDIILYDGRRREIEDISDRSIKMRDLDAPDFGGILRSTSDVLSYDGWKDDMNAKGFEILSKAEQTKPELTEKEKAFLETDIASIMAKSVLAWDEIEDIGYILYEDGYINKHSASENRSFGRELSEPELYDMAYRMQNGEDIRKELSTSLLGKPNVFTFENDNTFKVKYGEKEISAIFGNAEKTISYETMGNAFLSLIEGEYNDIIHDRTVEDLEYLIPDLTNENAEQLITAFDNARMADWKGDTIKETKIKKVLYDILNDDDKTEKAFASIAYMKYNYKVTQPEPKAENVVEQATGKGNETELKGEQLSLFDESEPLTASLSAEQKAERAALKAEQSTEVQFPRTATVGDRFRHKITGEISEIVSLTGALPFYTDDCTVQRESGGFAITENISYDKLLNSGMYEYIGKAEPEKEQSEPVKPEPVAEVTSETEKPDILDVKNLSQLKKAIQPGMMFEITDHLRPECIGERRIVTGVSTVDFTSKKLDENGEPMGKDLHMEFDRAKNWTFDGGELTSRLDNGDMLMSFHFIDSLEREQTVQAEKEPELAPEKTAPELSVGDYLEYKGKEYKVESLDMGGFITLTDTALEDAPRLISRVTFLTDEFIRSGEYMVITPEKGEVEAPAPDKGDNFTITNDTLGEGGAKTKFRANVDAIRTLKTLEAEKRPATAEEKETLSKYVGWGGIAQAFDKDNTAWQSEYAQLKELLTPQEYNQAKASVLDSFYTSPTVIDGMYSALERFGFKGGNILEPSMGVGNFFGRMPEEMQKISNLYGVEIDSISGRIAQKLYPNADIKIQGFEKNSYQNGCFDVAVGNVPFGELGFKDQKHGTNKLHDYFFAETLDKVKDGGIVAFVTSAGTLDKRDETTRKMLSEKADLIGAIRLPGGKDGAFKNNAGTEVTTDIIFLQKRSGNSVPTAETPDWVHIGETADGLPINKYFEKNPEMVLGEVIEGNKLYGNGTMVIAKSGAELKEQIKNAVNTLNAKISSEQTEEVYAKNELGEEVHIPSDLRDFSFFEENNNIYLKRSNNFCELRLKPESSKFNRVKSFIELRDITRELLTAQEFDKPDDVIKDLQNKLNTAYDKFYSKFGLLHSKYNKSILGEDISYSVVSSLEAKIKDDKLVAKSDIFTKRTIKPPKPIEHVETALEALTLSVTQKGKVDFEYMKKLTDMSEEKLKQDLTGEIYKIPHTLNEYQTASEYLSGDISKKLKTAEKAAEYDTDFIENVQALQKAMPEPLKAGDIDIRLGATWVNPEYYEQFIYELLETPYYMQNRNRRNLSGTINVEYSDMTNVWHINNKNKYLNVLATQTYGSKDMNAYDIIENLLNLKEPKVNKKETYIDEQGEEKERTVVDINATRIVQQKAEVIRAEFKKWIFKDSERRKTLVAKYNELFNSVKPREYDGSNLTFPMMNTEITLQPHQKNAVAHAIFGGNTLFAHCVGAGKTYEMISAAMESKRLGLCTKSLFAVPNHLTEQIGADFMKLYPSANILVATKKDFQKENRQQLFAKIATGNFDAVIIGHSQLGMIPLSRERQEKLINDQIDDIIEGISELKQEQGSKFQIKQLERQKKTLEKQLSNLDKKHDDNITFEQLGIDKLFVDEAHEFKNLFTPTKLSGVSGISNSSSQKAQDLFMKCRYLDEKTGGRGVTFATGTPVSNSITELHTMMRYLEYDFLKDHGLQNFDNWISVFGKPTTDWELAPAGNTFRQRTRLEYDGMPELMSMFKQVADIRTSDTLDLDVPDCEYKVVNVEASPFQQELVNELADRADLINKGSINPKDDNMLKITSDGRKVGLDPRLINPEFEDNPNTKLNKCVENVSKIYKDTAEEKLTQIIFCDLGVPHKKVKAGIKIEANEQENDDKNIDSKSIIELESLEEECDFCVYDDIKKKLVANGIKENEIAYIHEAKTEEQKSKLFQKVRSGEIRVIIGSTAKMGTGTNIQDKLIALHDLDIPWRPSDMEQRAGRIIRQGNQNKNVSVYRYVTKGTFDAYSYQLLEKKQKNISQIMTSKQPMRKCEDVDQQAMTYSEIKAQCTGDSRIKEKLQLDTEVKKLKTLSANYQNSVYEMQDKIEKYPDEKQKKEKILSYLKADKEKVDKLPVSQITEQPYFSIKINGTEYTDKKEAAKAFENAALRIKQDKNKEGEKVQIGEFQGFPLSIYYNQLSTSLMDHEDFRAYLSGEGSSEYAIEHTIELNENFAVNINRMEKALYKGIEQKICSVQAGIEKLDSDYKSALEIINTPFAQAEELEAKEKRLKELTEELNNEASNALKDQRSERKVTNYFKLSKEEAKEMKIEQKANKPTHRFSIDKLERRAKIIEQGQNQKSKQQDLGKENNKDI